MKITLGFPRPTLVWRVVLALVIAWSMVWIVLAAYLSYQETDQDKLDVQMRGAAESLLASIASTTDPSVAGTTIASACNLVNWSQTFSDIPTMIRMELSDINGRAIFLSPEPGSAALFAGTEPLASRTLDGVKFRVLRMASPHWVVKIAFPQFGLGSILLANLNHGDLNRYLLIAFPFVLVPIWLAVARGLRPLKQLSKRIAAKDPNDLTPLGVDTKYAELLPLAAAIDSLIARLHTKVEREHAFVQDAAHELRTPLALISIEAHVMTMAGTVPERHAAQLRLDQAIARTSHLIQQLLVLAHIDSEQLASSETVDVAAVARHEIALLAPAAIHRNIELSLETPDIVSHQLHLHTLQSILQNLLNNAIAYIQTGGRIVVRISRDERLLRLSVADDGPGIPESQRQLVFERFYRGADHDTPGSGLGLAIVSQGAARLGGLVRLEPGLEGRGCEFVIEVPTLKTKLG